MKYCIDIGVVDNGYIVTTWDDLDKVSTLVGYNIEQLSKVLLRNSYEYIINKEQEILNANNNTD